MTLLFVDGFDYYLVGDMSARYYAASPSGMDKPGRSGIANTQSVRITRDGVVTKLLPGGAKAKVIAGVAAKCSFEWVQVWDGILVFKSGNTVQVRIDVDPTTGEVKAC